MPSRVEVVASHGPMFADRRSGSVTGQGSDRSRSRGGAYTGPTIRWVTDMAARWTDPPLRVSKDELLRRMMGVKASMERDGWGPVMRLRDQMPADWHPTAEGLRFLWWRDYGVPEWFVPPDRLEEPHDAADEDQS
jgi:hypothetical protein